LVDLGSRLRPIGMWRAGGILFQTKPHEHADCSRERHRDQQADKTEQVAESENGEDDLDGVELDSRVCPVCEFWHGRDRFIGQKVH